MTSNYERAKRLIERGETEKGLTVFIKGVDNGECKCAYGIVRCVTQLGSLTLSVDEAISIFAESYADIFELAEEGDDEAMVMIAEAMRYGFVEEGDDPYFMWLCKAAEVGNEEAVRIIAELDEIYSIADLIAVPTQSTSETSLIAYRGAGALTVKDADEKEAEVILRDAPLIAEPDFALLEEVGIIDYLKDRQRQRDADSCNCLASFDPYDDDYI